MRNEAEILKYLALSANAEETTGRRRFWSSQFDKTSTRRKYSCCRLRSGTLACRILLTVMFWIIVDFDPRRRPVHSDFTATNKHLRPNQRSSRYCEAVVALLMTRKTRFRMLQRLW